MVLERVFSKSSIPIAARASLHNIAGLCKFVLCGDPQGSASAGAAILGMAKSSVSYQTAEQLCFDLWMAMPFTSPYPCSSHTPSDCSLASQRRDDDL